MNYATWLTVIGICALGAMSPGPSLAVVLRHALQGGRRNGSIAAITHGLGIGLYALLCISDLAVVITASPFLFKAFQWAGAAYLAWMGIKGLLAKPAANGELQPASVGSGAARDGFLIVFLNPKVAVFFIALFSQVIGPDTAWLERGLYVATAWLIDTGWYLLVAATVTHPRWLGVLQRNAVWFDRAFGVILLLLAIRLVLETLA
ncbi:MAG TPA: LysE family translocator [Xanthomonadales bacterium]|nr:LysE family translocator [Xanthomonadales bacterium]